MIADHTRSRVARRERSCSESASLGRATGAAAGKPAVINIGLRGFADDLHANGVRVAHQQWEPAAGGNERMQRLIALMQ